MAPKDMWGAPTTAAYRATVAFAAWVERRPNGRFAVNFPPQVRDLLADLAVQLRQLLESGEDTESTVRLFPPAYVDDTTGFNDEYQRLMHDDLLKARLERAQVLEQTAAASDVSEEELLVWMSSLNDLRLVLGTRLDISEETFDHELSEDDPDTPALQLYSLLTHVQEEVVQALAG